MKSIETLEMAEIKGQRITYWDIIEGQRVEGVLRGGRYPLKWGDSCDGTWA